MHFRGEWKRGGLGRDEFSILKDLAEYASNFFGLDSERCRMDALDIVISWGRSPYKGGQTTYDAKTRRGRVDLFLRGIGEVQADFDRVLLVMSHELIHCKQWGFSELDWAQTKQGQFFMWEKKPYTPTGYKAFAAYADTPWEREAFENQGVLLDWYRKTKLAEL